MKLGFLHVEGKDTLRYRKLATRMVASAKAVMPGLEIVQMTDTRTPIIEGVDRAVRMKPDNEDFMPYRLKHLALFEGDAVFLDTDVIVKQDLRGAFDQPFDIGLTKRDYPIMVDGKSITEDMPYNTGVMFSRSSEFFHDAYRYCLELHQEHRDWFGDQMAVKAIANTGRYRVHEFDCAVWNRVPVRADDFADGKAIHYKGEKRKAWMLA